MHTMTQVTDIPEVLRLLQQAYPHARCALQFASPFQLLVATILSAQCTDQQVNRITPALFARYPDAPALAVAAQADIEVLIYSTGFFRNKAKHLVRMAQALCAEHGGQVPQRLNALVALPGVARKTANVVLGVCFARAEGIVVDTHVMRLAKRLGLTSARTPIHIERALMGCIPKKKWIILSHQLIEHGRRICGARKPACLNCLLAPLCPSAEPCPGVASRRGPGAKDPASP